MKIKTFLFIGVILSQLAVPTWLASSSQMILSQGALYKFKTQPVDPYDIFRGRYVRVNPEEDHVDLPLNYAEEFFEGQKVFVSLLVDDKGFAKAKGVSSKKPLSGDYIATKISYVQKFINVQIGEQEWKQEAANIVSFNLPLDRFYMNEKKAPKAEQIYRERATLEKSDVHLTVRVYRGKALIENLFVGDQAISDFVQP
jgi:uncharacterized membrane-anchored protein